MKNTWKKILVGAVLTTTMVGFSGCKRGNNNYESVDLDGDGVISEWETVFQPMNTSDRVVYKTVKNIGSFDELKAINGKDKDTAYVLTSNIDCNGETLAINIGPSNYLYGNNKIIMNFKLGKATFDGDDENSGFNDYLSSKPNSSSYCLFYNAGAVYDLRVFMGNQNFAPNDQDTSFDASALNSVQYVDNVIIKGAINVKPHVDDAYKTYNLALGIVDHSNENIEISNIETVGVVSYEDSDPNRQNAEEINISGIIPNVSYGSTVYNANTSASLNVNSKASMYIGLIASKNYGFVSSCTASGNINATYTENSNLICGGIVGDNAPLSEIKNCTMLGKIDFTSNISFATVITLKTRAYVGGIVGKASSSVVNFVTNDGTITGRNLTSLVIGGICGEAEDVIFSNVIARGAINLSNIDGLHISHVAGKMAYGLIEKAILLNDMTVDNRAYDLSTIRMGMVTIFEDGNLETFEGDDGTTVDYYDMLSSDQKTPQFAHILVGGKNVVYTKKSLTNSKQFEYSLGLRNPFKYETMGENGDELESYVPMMKRFTGLYYLETYKLQRFDCEEDYASEVTLAIKYQENISSRGLSTINTGKSFKNLLELNYGTNHAEVDLSGIANSEESFKTIKYTLSETSALNKYFETAQYNGELSRFDKKFDTPYDLGDENYSVDDELFSFINYYVGIDVSGISGNSIYMPLLVSNQFFSGVVVSEDANGDTQETNISSASLFVDRIIKVLSKMNCTASMTCYTVDGEECDASASELNNIKVVAVNDNSTNTYIFDFDVRNFMDKNALLDDKGTAYYIINLLYSKS